MNMRNDDFAPRVVEHAADSDSHMNVQENENHVLDSERD